MCFPYDNNGVDFVEKANDVVVPAKATDILMYRRKLREQVLRISGHFLFYFFR